MGSARFGVSSLSNNALSPTGGTITSTFTKPTLIRVRDIILDSSHPLFEENGEWGGIGLVLGETINAPLQPNSAIRAYPLYPNLKQYPLINEIVVVFTIPSIKVGNITPNNDILYYISPMNIWGSQHHNAIPYQPLNDNNFPPSQNKNYQQTSAGSTQKVTSGGTEIILGNTFVEQLNINPLQPFEGDYIVEGRFGQSLRFGSSEGKDPITKIRNGQGENTTEGWTTIEENINEDKASIYLTSTQQVNLEPNIFNYNSYTTTPESVENYSSNQVLINSGRLVLNANVDSVLLSSAKSINLNSQDSVNIDSKNQVVINSPSILLGDKNATEPVLKGDITIELLSELVDELGKWMAQFNTNPSPYLAPLKVSTTPLISTLVKLKVELETKTKSKVSKTI